jgi:hypothetical protein
VWWCSDACVALKKKMIRLLMQEIMVRLAEASQALTVILPWHGGGHTTVSRSKPLSGAVQSKTPAQDIDVLRKMAGRYSAGERARVLSTLGSTPARGKRWPQTRVAYTRTQSGIGAVDKATLDPTILTLGQAGKETGGRDTTLMKLSKKELLPCHQRVPYAPLAMKKTALETEPVRSSLDSRKETGALVLAGVSLGRQHSLFQSFQLLKKEGYYEGSITLMALPKRWINVTDPGWTLARGTPRATAWCT